MAFRQQLRPQNALPVSQSARIDTAPSQIASAQGKRRLDESEEWVLFSPLAPSITNRTHITTSEQTPRTTGLSRFSEFGSLDTAARSDHDADQATLSGTEGEELDSLDDGLHAFHEPSEHSIPAIWLLESNDTVLPAHDGLGEFQPLMPTAEHLWQFERPRRRPARRRSSVQRHLATLDEAGETSHEQERRLRIEQWRQESSRLLLEEIAKETRRRRRMSAVSNAQKDSAQDESILSPCTGSIPAAVEILPDSSDEEADNLSFWQRITRRVIRDLIGLDQNTLSIMFGESLSADAQTSTASAQGEFCADRALQEAGIEVHSTAENDWQSRLLERVAQELGSLVNRLSEHPGAFSTYRAIQSTPDYVGFTPSISRLKTAKEPSNASSTAPQPIASSHISAQFTPTFVAAQPSQLYSEVPLWGIEEESDVASLPAPHDDTRRSPTNIAEDLACERAYWERDLDIKMVCKFLLKRFSTRQPTPSFQSSQIPPPPISALSTTNDKPLSSARRAAFIREHHPLAPRTTTSPLPTSSVSLVRENTRRKDAKFRSSSYMVSQPSRRQAKMRSTSSCASQSTKKSRRTVSTGRNYWDIGGSGAGSVVAAEI